MRRFAALALLPASISISFGGNLDVAKLRKALVNVAHKDYPGLTVGAPTCPGKVKLKKGTVTTCTIAVSDATLTYRVTQTDSKGNVDILPAQALLIVSKLEALVVGAVEKATGEKATASCGTAKVLAVAPGKTVRCEAETTSNRATITALVEDVEGNVHITG